MKTIDTSNAAALHKQRKKMYAAGELYRQTFISKKTGCVKSHLSETRDCPVCSSKRNSTLFIKNGGSYVRCDSCAMVYLNPALTDESLKTYYKNNHNYQAIAHIKEKPFYERIYKSGLKQIKNHQSSGKLLDIGCSAGYFMEMARRSGFNCSGIEFNKTEAAAARRKGFIVIETPLEDTNTVQGYDVVALWDVFEHIKDGVSFLKQIKSRLNKNGTIFLQIPNVMSLAARVLQDRCNMFDGVEHVNLYGPSTIKQTAQKAGLKLISMKSVIAETGPLSNYLNYEEPYEGSFGDKTLMRLLSPKNILQANLGYKLQLVLAQA